MRVKYSWYRSFSHWGMFEIVEICDEKDIFFDEIDQKYYYND